MLNGEVIRRADHSATRLREGDRLEVVRLVRGDVVAEVDDGVHAIGKKLVEEAAESWMAAVHESRERTAEELSQLLYHAQVLMLACDLSLDDVYAHL